MAFLRLFSSLLALSMLGATQARLIQKKPAAGFEPAVIQAPTAVSCPGQFTPVAKPNPTIHCGSYGELKNSQPVGPSTKTTLQSCVASCKSSSSCFSFGYSKSGSCTLYLAPLVKQGYVKHKDNLGTTFYNRHCFACNTPVPACKNGTICNASTQNLAFQTFCKLYPNPTSSTGMSSVATNSYQDCLSQCVTDPVCNLFSWNSVTSSCNYWDNVNGQTWTSDLYTDSGLFVGGC